MCFMDWICLRNLMVFTMLALVGHAFNGSGHISSICYLIPATSTRKCARQVSS